MPTVSELIKSLLFIPPTFGGANDAGSAIRPIVGPAHTLLYEILFYLIFYISARINHKNRGVITSLVLLAIMALRVIFDFDGNEILLKYTNTRLMNFVLGILLFYVLQRLFLHTELMDRAKPYSLGLIAVSALFICVIALADIRQLLVSLLSLLTVLGFIAAFYGRKDPRFLTFLGDISYSFYLLHYYVILVMSKLIGPMTVCTVKSVACAGAALLVSIPATFRAYRLIEVKLANYLSKKRVPQNL